MEKEKRKLSSEEQQFIDRMMQEKSVNKNTTAAKKTKNKKRMPYQNLSYWAFTLFLVPVAMSTSLFYYIHNVQNFLEEENIEWLNNSNIIPNVDKISQEDGYSWFREFLFLYENRMEIVAVLFTITILVVAIILIVDNIHKRRKDSED